MSCTAGNTQAVSAGNGSTGFPSIQPVNFGSSLLTPEFQTWFGNSQVVDTWGSPKQVFHGTTEKFDRFEYGDIGFHLGSKTQAGNRLSRMGGDGYIMAAYVSIQNPLRMRDVGVWHNWQAIGVELLHSDVITAEEYERAWNARDEFGELRAILREKGYDGIVYRNEVEGRGDSWIAFCPDQIKVVNSQRKRGR